MRVDIGMSFVWKGKKKDGKFVRLGFDKKVYLVVLSVVFEIV